VVNPEGRIIDGKIAWLRSYNVNGGNNFTRFRDIGMRFDFYVGYVDGTIVIDTGKPYAYDVTLQNIG
jgi:hypothetical protein